VSFTTNTYNIEAQHSLEFGLGQPAELWHQLSLQHRRRQCGLRIRTRRSISGSISRTSGRYVPLSPWWPVVRYDLHTRINGTWSPRVALVYNLTPEHTVSRFSGSVAYRPPTLFESNLDLRILPTVPPLFAPIPLLGSQRLNPEQIISYEAGYQGWWMKHRLRTRLDLFFNHLSDLINFQTVGTARTLVNGGEADIYGTEAGLEFLATRWLSGFANVSYQKIGQTFTGVSGAAARTGKRTWASAATGTTASTEKSQSITSQAPRTP
jgi:iron complex outermembrane receptor protein